MGAAYPFPLFFQIDSRLFIETCKLYCSKTEGASQGKNRDPCFEMENVGFLKQQRWHASRSVMTRLGMLRAKISIGTSFFAAHVDP